MTGDKQAAGVTAPIGGMGMGKGQRAGAVFDKGGEFDVRIIIAVAVLCLVPCAPLLAADTIILRCEARGESIQREALKQLPIAEPLRVARQTAKAANGDFQ